MGMTLTLDDFAAVAQRPRPVMAGVFAQYTVMVSGRFEAMKDEETFVDYGIRVGSRGKKKDQGEKERRRERDRDRNRDSLEQRQRQKGREKKRERVRFPKTNERQKEFDSPIHLPTLGLA